MSRLPLRSGSRPREKKAGCLKKAACTEERTGTLAARGAAAPRRAQETKGQGKCRPCGQFAQKLLKNT